MPRRTHKWPLNFSATTMDIWPSYALIPLPNNRHAFGNVSIKDEILDGDESVNVNLSIDESDSHQIVRLEFPKDDSLTDVRHQETIQLGYKDNHSHNLLPL